MDIAELKQKAAEYAVDHFVTSNMVVGLGSGSTAVRAVRYLYHLLEAGKLENVLGVACSLWIESEARQLGIPLTTLAEHATVDVTIDGADEVDTQLNLIKGGGGALLREKIVAQASHREVIIVDNSKVSPAIGTHWGVPIEIVAFGWEAQRRYVESLGARTSLRLNTSGKPFQTDSGNYILDCNFGVIEDPEKLALQLSQRAGIVEHGMFLGIATDVIVASLEGIQHMECS